MENKPNYQKLNGLLKELWSLMPNPEERRQISRCLKIAAEEFSSVNTELAYAVEKIIERVPAESFGTYAMLLQRAFAYNSVTESGAERMYHKVISLIDKNIERQGFLKSVLRAIDSEVCASIEGTLPHDHPYLQDESPDS